MAIQGIEQPEIIQIDHSLRLQKFDGNCSFALSWYQDTDMVSLVDGKREVYTMEKLERMYKYLSDIGELYFIEILENGKYQPIGDVTFWKQDMPIVIGEQLYRGRGIGRKVITALANRGRKLGYHKIYVEEIYNYNESSRRCFESAGFRAYERTKQGARYVKEL